MHAGAKEGTFVADNIKVDGKYFFVNADVKGKGQLKVELLDEKGNPIPGFTKRDCAVMRSADKTKQQNYLEGQERPFRTLWPHHPCQVLSCTW